VSAKPTSQWLMGSQLRAAAPAYASE